MTFSLQKVCSREGGATLKTFFWEMKSTLKANLSVSEIYGPGGSFFSRQNLRQALGQEKRLTRLWMFCLRAAESTLVIFAMSLKSSQPEVS